MQEIFLGRQPILDRNHDLVAYELLFRHSAEASEAQIADDLSAGTNVLVNTFSNMDANWLLGDKLAFINIAAPMLESDSRTAPRQKGRTGTDRNGGSHPGTGGTHPTPARPGLSLCPGRL